MHFRKKGLRPVSLDEPANRETGAPKREQGKVDERLSTSIDRIMLTRAMKELPAGYRTIFLLHEVKGYEHHEIARLLRCSVGNSKSQLHKAKARMRDLLGQQKAQNETQAASSGRTALQNLVTGEPGFRQPTRAPVLGTSQRSRGLNNSEVKRLPVPPMCMGGHSVEASHERSRKPP